MRKYRFILVSVLLLVIVACVILPSGFSPTPGSVTTPNTGQGETPFIASADFTATSSSPGSVLLTWKTVQGALGYQIEYSWNGQDFYPMIELPASLTQYEDFLALPDRTYTYRIQTVTAAGPGDWSMARITTASREPNPLTVQPVYDESRASLATIGPAGGVISVDDAGGVSYELDIPAGALAVDTEIQLIPVNEMTGWPLDGELLAAVRIEPAGLQLLDVATLKINLPAASDPGLATVGFAFGPAGEDFHLRPIESIPAGTGYLLSSSRRLAAPVQQTRHVIQLPVIELHGNGAGQGSTNAITDLARNNSPADPGAAADQRQAAANAYQDDLAALPQVEGQVKVDTSPERQAENEAVHIWEQIDQAVDGDSLNSAMVKFQQWRNKVASLLAPDQYKDNERIAWDDFTTIFKQMLDKAAEDCKKSSGNPAPDGVGKLQQMVTSASNPPSTPGAFWDVLQSKMTTKYGDSVFDRARAGLMQGVCGSYKPTTVTGYDGKICSLARPFTLTESILADQKTINFIPDSLEIGTVNVQQTIANGLCTFKGTGAYTVTYYPNGEADIKYQYTGSLTCPPADPIPNADQPALHIRIKQVSLPECK